MPRRILLPIADLTTSAAAVRYAEHIAAVARAELYLLHIAKQPFRCGRYDGHARAYTRSEDILPSRSTLILGGRPAQMIVAYADEMQADLILMPTRGRGTLRQLLLGSTTMDVLRRTGRAVLVVKTRWLTTEEPMRCKSIVCAIDINAEGEEVLKQAAQVAAARNSTLTLVHVIPGISNAVMERYRSQQDRQLAFPLGEDDPRSILHGWNASREIDILLMAARRCLAAIATQISVPIQVDVRIGDPAECLRGAVKDHSADLVILGRGKTTNRWSTGANISQIIAGCACPVITYRHQDVPTWTGRSSSTRRSIGWGLSAGDLL